MTGRATAADAAVTRRGRRSRITRRIQRYRSSAGWLLLDLVRAMPFDVALLGVASGAAIASRAATFSLLVVFIRGVTDPASAAGTPPRSARRSG